MYKHKVLFICIANHCRSPVAEYLAKKYFNNNIYIDSCALGEPISLSMHELSQEFLIKNKIQTYHGFKSKKISRNLIKSSNFIIVFSQSMKTELIKNFPEYSSRIYTLTHFKNKCDIKDPFKKDNTTYANIMESIKENIKIWSIKI